MKKILILLVLGIFLLGCTQYGGTTPPAGQDGAGTNDTTGGTPAQVTIHIKNYAFDPAEVTVKQGDTVTWVNDDTVPHTVTFDVGFSSQTLSNGQSYSHTFTEATGDYTYHCSIHTTMLGKVTITK